MAKEGIAETMGNCCCTYLHLFSDLNLIGLNQDSSFCYRLMFGRIVEGNIRQSTNKDPRGHLREILWGLSGGGTVKMRNRRK